MYHHPGRWILIMRNEKHDHGTMTQERDAVITDKLSDFRILFGQNLCRIRKARGYSQDSMAAGCGISRAHYGRIERGEHAATIDTCYLIATFLQIDVSVLFSDLPL